eukprot:scaffold1300_cov317-Prasinococcus_capsulatus_cf.AAC.22
MIEYTLEVRRPALRTCSQLAPRPIWATPGRAARMGLDGLGVSMIGLVWAGMDGSGLGWDAVAGVGGRGGGLRVLLRALQADRGVPAEQPLQLPRTCSRRGGGAAAAAAAPAAAAEARVASMLLRVLFGGGRAAQHQPFQVHPIVSTSAMSAGEALRFIDERQVVRSDFVLVFGDTVSNMYVRRRRRPRAFAGRAVGRGRARPHTQPRACACSPQRAVVSRWQVADGGAGGAPRAARGGQASGHDHLRAAALPRAPRAPPRRLGPRRRRRPRDLAGALPLPAPRRSARRRLPDDESAAAGAGVQGGVRDGPGPDGNAGAQGGAGWFAGPVACSRVPPAPLARVTDLGGGCPGARRPHGLPHRYLRAGGAVPVHGQLRLPAHPAGLRVRAATRRDYGEQDLPARARRQRVRRARAQPSLV